MFDHIIFFMVNKVKVNVDLQLADDALSSSSLRMTARMITNESRSRSRSMSRSRLGSVLTYSLLMMLYQEVV